MFRPCIDFHEGKVKQIVGGTLSNEPSAVRTNFVSPHSAVWYAELYREDGLKGGHVVLLGPGNETEARSALRAYPGGLQVGGGVTPANARDWLEAGASHVIVTSWVFSGGEMHWERLQELTRTIGRDRLVLDLSCRLRNGAYVVVTDRWQKFTNLLINRENLEELSKWFSEFLVHAVDVEGLCQGIDQELVSFLAKWSPLPATYAGGARSLADLETVTRLSDGRVDLTIGSALDIFGGSGVRYEELVEFNRREAERKPGVTN